MLAVAGCISLQTLASTQTTLNNGTFLAKNKPSKTKAQKELPKQWYSLYQISDRLLRANGQLQHSWLFKLTPEYDHSAFAQNRVEVNLNQDIFNKLSPDPPALACLLSHELAHRIQKHGIITAEKQGEEIRRIRDEAEQEVEAKIEQEEQNDNRNSDAIDAIGGLFGGGAERTIDDVGEVFNGSTDVPDREKMFNEIFAQKKQKLKASWRQKYRQQELEADKFAYTYVAKAGYQPEGCIRGIEAMAKTPALDSKQIVLDTQQRVANIQKLMTKYPVATLYQEGKVVIDNSKPLKYDLAGDKTALEVGKNISPPEQPVVASSNAATNSRQLAFESRKSEPFWQRLTRTNPYDNKRNNIVFSERPLASERHATTNKQQFDANDTIYARIKFDRPLYQVFRFNYEDRQREGSVRVALEIYGKHGDQWEYIDPIESDSSTDFRIAISPEQKEQNYLDLDILPRPGEEVTRYPEAEVGIGLYGFLDFLAKFNFEKWHYQNPGYQPMNNYAFGISVGSRAVGQVFISMTPEQLQALAKRNEQQQAAIASSQASARQLPDEFYTPLVPFQDPELSIDNIKQMLSDRHEILKIAIGPGTADYTVATGNYDVENVDVEYVNAQMTARNIWVAYRDSDGKCYFQTVTFQRDYMGGGQYGELREVWASVGENSSDPTAIACENIN